MLEKVDWNKYGVVNGVARDPRCENCMVHCGYEQSGALGTNYQGGDNWKNFKYNFWPKPKPYEQGRKVNAFNGFSAGKGHLAEAKAAVKAGLAGARPEGRNAVNPGGSNSSCGTGDSSQRDKLLAKIAEQARAE